MTNFIFKSRGTFKKISNLLEVILAEQRHQRQDNIQILFLLNKVLVEKNLKQQATDFYDQETSHQTELDEQ